MLLEENIIEKAMKQVCQEWKREEDKKEREIQQIARGLSKCK